MWLAILTFLYSLPFMATLGIGLRACAHRKNSGFWLIAAALSGRWILRLFRRGRPDDPKPLIPDRRGVAFGRDGVRLEWEQFGPDNAPPLLLCHGWSLTHDTWFYQKQALAGEFRVIVWDMRGTGRSSAPPNRNYSMAALKADLAAVFDAAQAGEHPSGCILAGHSLGAMLLPLFAVAYPKRMQAVRGLALLAGTDTPLLESMCGRQWLAPLRCWVWEPLGRVMAACYLPFQAYAWLAWQTGAVHLALMAGRHNDHGTRGQNDLVARHCAEFSMRAAGQGAQACFGYDTRALLPQIHRPVLLLVGEDDPNMPPEIQEAMAGRLLQSELVILPHCGHLCLLECHEAVSANLRRFARRCLGTNLPPAA
jgi:pimeloyl-ACP methyl ester carboxylesterase